MRTEQHMLDLILSVARQDERVRAVVLNGSRANPNARHDPFRDFDVQFLVTEAQSFKASPHWIDIFGERMVMQLPDDMQGEPDRPGYAYLMQFQDGNRIDLSLEPLEHYLSQPIDSLTVLLLDKDARLPALPLPSERDYLPVPPTALQFAECCNEFWWVNPYVAKGLWRRELPYALGMLQILREQLMKMLTWQIGVQTAFQVDPGKMGKYLQKYLSPEEWSLFLQTHTSGEYNSAWEALFALGAFFRRSALLVAENFGYPYPAGEDERVSAFIRRIQTLPPDVQELD